MTANTWNILIKNIEAKVKVWALNCLEKTFSMLPLSSIVTFSVPEEMRR